MGSDNLFRKKRVQRQERKSRNIRQRPNKWLIVCEGVKTEPNYFKGLINYINSRIDKENKLEVTYAGEGMNTISLVNRAEELQQVIDRKNKETLIPYGVTIVVFDKDSFNDDDFNKAIKMCESNGYLACWSNQAIEYFFLLHFIYCDSKMDRNDYNKKLNEQLKKSGTKIKYKKNLANIFELLHTYGDVLNAVNNSKKIHQNKINQNISPAKSESCSTIYKLFDKLEERSEELGIESIKDILRK